MNRLLVGMLGYASKPALLSGEILVILAQQVGVGREEGGGFLWLFGWLGWQKLLYGCFYFKKNCRIMLSNWSCQVSHEHWKRLFDL
jgi:hypothetical protein